MQLTSLAYTKSSQKLLELTYADGAGGRNNGQITGITDTSHQTLTPGAAGQQSFTRSDTGVYPERRRRDELNRLKQAKTQASSGAQCFGIEHGYDIWANLLTITQLGTHPACTTSLSQSVATNNRITTLSYDLAGNQLSDGSYAMAWDAESRMKSGAGVNYTGVYPERGRGDGDGRRTKKSSGKLYWYSISGDVLAESDLAGTISDEFIFFGGKRIARRASSGNVFYYLGDHLGTSRVIVQGGQNTACYESDYEPFGKERIVTDTCPQSYKFTGKERDTESNLDYFGARYYAATQGRFLSPDPLLTTMRPQRPQTLNRYSYVLNNPLRFIDPDGLYEEDFHRDLTTVLAMAAGFAEKTAAEIGEASIGTDSGETGPFTSNKQTRKDFHFAGEKRLGVMWDTFMAGGGTKELGQYLHTLQDSFSHSEQIKAGRTEHVAEFTAPDKTFKDPAKADKLAQVTYEKLLVAGKRTGAAGAIVPWEKIDTLVKDFNKEKDSKKKQDILNRIREGIRQSQAKAKDKDKDKKEEK